VEELDRPGGVEETAASTVEVEALEGDLEEVNGLGAVVPMLTIATEVEMSWQHNRSVGYSQLLPLLILTWPPNPQAVLPASRISSTLHPTTG
jgi:hypothetical protein